MTAAGWRPSADPAALRARAELIGRIRAFFADRDVLEVETPVLGARGVTDTAIEGFRVESAEGARWLQTSPEYAMKRLVAAGVGSCYQIARAFRSGERGRLHNPEFTLLEWYRTGFDHVALMVEVADLASALVPRRTIEHITYREAFGRVLEIDPLAAPDALLCELVVARCGAGPGVTAAGRDDWLDLLFGAVVAPTLGHDRFTFVCDFPASQAALARLRPDAPSVAERFELFIDGIEIANGFHELVDPEEQRARFQRDREARRAAGLEDVVADERLLAALEHGLPPCAGVALGLDRLIMLALGAESIAGVMAFDWDHA